MQISDNFKKAMVSAMSLFVAAFLITGTTSAADTAGLVRQIQKSFSPIQRHITTQPQQAEKELAEVMTLLQELKTADPENRNIPRLEKKIDQLNKKLAKRLGKTVKPVTRPSSPPPPPRKKALQETAPTTAKPVSTQAIAATKGEKLPGGVTSRTKRIDKALDKVTKALGKNSVQRAELEFKKVTKIRKEIQDRYGDKIPPGHPEIVALDERIAEVEKRLKMTAGEAAAAALAAKKAEEEKAALVKEWASKLDAYTTRGSDKWLDEKIWNLKGEAAERNRRNYAEATALFAEYKKVEFPQEDRYDTPMELQNSERRLMSVLERMKNVYAKEETEKGSEEWVKKLEPFVTSMGGKRLIASYTGDVAELLHQKQIYQEASALFEEYLQAKFPPGKSFRLQQIEEQLADELAKFPDIFQRSAGDQVKNAEEKLAQEIAFLNRKQEWKSDSGKLPYFLSEDRISDSRKFIARAAELLPADDPNLARLHKKMAALVKMNDERRKVRAERTFMIADKFDDDGISGIKKKASELVGAKFSGIKILRATVISEDWNEKTVEEWTDTTKTAVRIRTTRSVTAQVAGKKSNGEVRLYTVYIAKNRRTDGTWGKLYGNLHSDKGDLMLEENVRR